MNTGYLKGHEMGRHLIEKSLGKGDNAGGICAFGIVLDDKRKVEDMPTAARAPCHAAYRYMYDGEEGALRIVDVLYPSTVHKDWCKEWYEYILKDSAYASMSMDKRISAGINRGYFFYDPQADGNVIGGGSVAIRMASEMPKIVRAFHHMIKGGVNPHLAFLIAHFTTVSDKKLSLNNTSIQGHTALEPHTMDNTSVTNFFNGNNNPLGKYVDARKYAGINNMFHHGKVNDDMWNKPILKGKSFNAWLYKEFYEDMSNVVANDQVPIFNHAVIKKGNGKSYGLGKSVKCIKKLTDKYIKEVINA